jgi:hypothetical protein
MAISDITGYVQGFRFSDAAQYWDSGNSRFIDQAGYGDFNGLTITAGTPAFVGSGATRGLTLDNTVQGKFLPACPWAGACLVVMDPDMSVNGSIYPAIFGFAASVASNGKVQLTRASASDYIHYLMSASAVLQPNNRYTTGDMAGVKVGAFAMSQETRKSYATKDGVTVTESAAVAAANPWVGMSGKDTNRTDAQFARFGNLSGTIGDTTITTNKMTIYELHFFKGNPLITDAAAVAAEIAALKTQYGAT